MGTTVAVVEILVAGLFAAVWVLTAVGLFAEVGWDSIRCWAKESKDWAAVLSAAGALVIYQLGWLVNGLSRAAMWPLANRVRDFLYEHREVSSRSVRETVYQEGSPAVLQDLALDQSVIRLSRAGIINFSITSLLLYYFSRPMTAVATVFLLLFGGCAIQWWQRNWRYYERLLDAYEVIGSKSDLGSHQPRRKEPPTWCEFLRWRRRKPHG